MIAFNEEVMNMIVRGGTESFTASEWDEGLGSSYDLALEVECEEMPNAGSSPAITVKVYTSNTGKRWMEFATVLNGASLGSIPYFSLVTQTGPLGRLVRLGVTIGGTGSPVARVRIQAVGRMRS